MDNGTINFRTGIIIPSPEDADKYPAELKQLDGSIKIVDIISYIITNGTGTSYEFDSVPRIGSPNPVTSDGIKSYVDAVKYTDNQAVIAAQNSVLATTTIIPTINNVTNKLSLAIKVQSISESLLDSNLVSKINNINSIPIATSSIEGLTKLYDALNTNIDGAVTPNAVKIAVDNVNNKGASDIAFTPNTNILSANIQAAIEEVYSKIGTGTGGSDYELPIATSLVLGGIKQGANTTINPTTGAISVAAPYVHPTSDGNSHLPANGTTSAGKIPVATAVAGQWILESKGFVPVGGAENDFPKYNSNGQIALFNFNESVREAPLTGIVLSQTDAPVTASMHVVDAIGKLNSNIERIKDGESVINARVDRLIFRNQVDPTKRFRFLADNVPESTTLDFTLPAVSGTLVTTTGSQTLKSKLIDTTNQLIIADNQFELVDNDDNTKVVVFPLGHLTTGSRWNIKYPNKHADLAPLDSPIFTGIPNAPLASQDDDSMQIANTAFVKRALDNIAPTNDTVSRTFGNFNGATQVILPQQTNADTSESGDFSIGAWVKFSTATSLNFIYEDGIGEVVHIAVIAGGQLRVGLGNTSTNFLVSTGTHNNNTWVHVGMSWKESTLALTMYINGLPVNNKNLSSRPTASINSNNAVIGGRNTAYFNGKIGPLRIWKKTLTNGEFLAEYNGSRLTTNLVREILFNGNVNDTSGVGNQPTTTGGLTYGTEEVSTLSDILIIDSATGLTRKIVCTNGTLSTVEI